MNQFKAYPAYKDSGVEWLGEVPEGWTVKPLRYLGRFRKGLTITKADLTDTGIPCLNYGEVHSLYPFEVNQDIHLLKRVPAKYLETDPFACVKYGDFVFADTSEDLDGVGNFSHVSGMEPLFAGYHTIIYSLNSEASSRFIAYCLESFAFRAQLRMGVKGVKVFSVTQEILRGGIAWLPTAPEQTQIAQFLDYETARIDALIEEQQRLIKLLKEKRQAVISHAVTKGLDPTAPMKDSGVEWLGEVPAHWEVLRIGAVYSEVADKGLAELPVLRVSIHHGVSDKELSEEESDRKITRIDDREKYKRVRPGDLVYNMMRAWQGGFGAVLVDGLVSPAYVVARPKNGDISRYVEQLLRTSCAIEEMRKNSYGITDFRLRLYWDQFKNIFIVIPPKVERQQIMERIDLLIRESETLKNEANQLIVILQERRSALISAAVTGKIDVRGWQSPAHRATPNPAQETL